MGSSTADRRTTNEGGVGLPLNSKPPRKGRIGPISKNRQRSMYLVEP